MHNSSAGSLPPVRQAPRQSPSKAQLRRSLLARRQHLSPDDWQQRSRELGDRLAASPLFGAAATVLSFVSHRQEPDVLPLRGQFPSKRWGLPRCEGPNLVWHEWELGDRLRPGAYGIAEPDPQAPEVLPNQVDLLLVPCVAIDRAGFRLGYGGGYYDRLLAQAVWQRIPAIGLCFELGRLERLPHDPWDRPLAGGCSEQELWLIEGADKTSHPLTSL